MPIKLTEPTTPDDQTEVISRDRDETQLSIDKVFGGLVERWNKAGKPKPENSPSHRYVVAKGDAAAVNQMIRRAATLHKHGVVFFKPKRDANGTVTIKFVPASKPAKAETPAG